MVYALALIMLAAPVQATGSVASLTGSGLDVAGDLSLAGDLAALRLWDPTGDAGATFPPIEATIEAASVFVSVDWWRFQSYAALDASPLLRDPIDARQTSIGDARGSNEHGPFDAASVMLGVPRGDFELHVLPLDSGAHVVATTPGLALAPAAGQHMVKLEANQTRAPPSRPLDAAIGHVGEAEAHVRIEGSFLVSLWAWDATVTWPEGNRSLTSGQRAGNTTSDPMGRATLDHDVRIEQVFIRVEDGVLSLPAGLGQLALYAIDSHIEDVETAIIRHAAGTAADGHQNRPLAGDEVSFAGDLALEVGRRHDMLTIHVTGSVAQASSNGQSLAWVAPMGPTPRSNGWLVGIAAPAMFAMALVARRQTAFWRLGHLDTLLARGDFAGVAAQATRLRGGALREEAAALHVEALVEMGDATGALRLLDDASRRTRDAPLHQYLRAYALAAAGRPTEATGHLATALNAAPALWHDARREPHLAHLLDHPRLAPTAPRRG